ncbi:MAG TPA: GNAT family N-acetyltransferase [bacterium (Candidatus Stahlbacteria)]|nr:GNAT family N-acetyltransferase [Candidatus Stahlbacteria bacterium]
MSDHDLELRVKPISSLAEEWTEIFARSGSTVPFLSYEWFQSLIDNTIKEDMKVISFYDQRIPVGILPASISGDSLRLIGDERITDINGLLYIPGYEMGILRALSDFIKDKGLKVDLYPVEKTDPLIKMADFIRTVKITDADPCPILSLPNSWEEFLQMLDSKSRHELRRKLKRASTLRLKPGGADRIDILFQMMSLSDRNKESFLTPEMIRFFKTIGRSFSAKGWLRYRLLVDGLKPIGTIFSFQIKKGVYLYNMGFDPAYAKLSPGIVLVALDIRSAIDEGVDYYDFLRGDEDYKLRFGAKIRYTMRIAG